MEVVRAAQMSTVQRQCALREAAGASWVRQVLSWHLHVQGCISLTLWPLEHLTLQLVL